MPQLPPPGWSQPEPREWHPQPDLALQPGTRDSPGSSCRPSGCQGPPLTERHQSLAGQSSWQPSTPKMAWHSLCPSELCLCTRPQHSSHLGQGPLPPRRDRLPTHAAEPCPGAPAHGISEQLITATRAQIRAAPAAPHSPREQPGPHPLPETLRAKDAALGHPLGQWSLLPPSPQTMPFPGSAPLLITPHRPLQQGGQRDAGGGGKSSKKPLWGRRQSRSHPCWQQSSKQKAQSFNQAKFGARVPPSAERGQDESHGAGAAPRLALAAREGRARSPAGHGDRREPLHCALAQAARVQPCL